MIRKRPTLQRTLAIAILLIGVIGIALVFVTDYTYRQLAYEQQKESVKNLLAIKSKDLIKKLKDRQIDLGYRLQSDPNFVQAIDKKDIEAITYWLDQEFNRYYVTIGLLKLEKIIVYDENFRLIALSERGITGTDTKRLPCQKTIKHVAGLPVIERTKSSSQLCEHNNQTLLSSVVSIGTLKPKGYLNIITDPAHVLTNIENQLGIPLRIFNKNHSLVHQSIDWPSDNDSQSYLLSSYPILDENKHVALYIEVASDITTFLQQLNNTRYQIIIAASALTLLTLLIAFIILYRGLLPLKQLRQAANSSARGEFTSVKENGYLEINAPIHAFNSMVEKIQSLINDLKCEVDNHKLTEQKFKSAKEKAEQHAATSKQQSNFLHMTLQSIVDGVITTTIDGHVQTINPMAEQLTGWQQSDAIGKPLVQVMHALDETTHKRIYNPTENIEHKSVLDEPINAILVQNLSNIETPVEYIVAPMRNFNDDIAGIVVIIHDESVQRSLNRQLTFQATHDALTGLINRYEFERRLKSVITSQSDDDSINTLCYIDLDQFKLVNDTCGHSAGDELLKQITLLLESHIADTGTLARLGGDEFGLLLENHDIEIAREKAIQILDIIKQFHFVWHENTFTISASIGIAPIPRSTISYEEILSNAHSACHLAKDNGRNRIQVFTDEDNKLLTQQREMHWVSRINHALQEDRFQLYF